MSGIAVVQEDLSERLYWFAVFYTNSSIHSKVIHLAVTSADDAHIAAVKGFYLPRAEIGSEQLFKFDGDSISLDIPNRGIYLDGWAILPSTSPKILKKDVNNYPVRSLRPPHCELVARWIEKNEDIQPLNYTIQINGTIEPQFFTISIAPEILTSLQATNKSLDDNNQIRITAATLPTERDIAKYLKVLSNQEIMNIGVKLGLRYASLKRMSSESLKDDMVLAWLRKDDDVGETSGDPSWKTLCTALKECGYTDIAESIEKSTRVVTSRDAGARGYSESLSMSEKEFCAKIEKYIRSSGVIDRFLAHLVFVGFPASGKTTLMYRLLDLAITIEASSSTGVMDGVIAVNIGEDKASMHAANVDEKMKWSKVKFDLSCLRQMGLLSTPKSDRKTSGRASDRVPDLQPMEVVMTTIQNTLKKKGYFGDEFRKNVLPFLKNKTTLYLSDTGGQIEFQELLPLLVAGCAIFLFLFPLNKDLDKPVRISYRKKGGGETNAYTSSLTIEESFLQTLSSIDSMRISNDSTAAGGNPSTELQHKPAVFVIGTHKDCLIEELGEAAAESKIAEIDERIKNLAKEHGYGDLVKYGDGTRVLFAVDNTRENDVFQKIRSRIMFLIHDENKFHITFPLSYLLASMHLDSKNDPFIKRSDFAEWVIEQYGIEEKDVDHLLRFLHTRIGQIRYFPLKEIKDDIVKEPQALYDIVTHLITESFLLPNNIKQDSEIKRGIYSLNSFKESSDILKPDKIIALLKELRIVAPFVDQKEVKTKFFIPCVLNHLEDPPKDVTSEISSIHSLAIMFDRGHCPKGMFGVLIHSLLTQDNSSNRLVWSLSIEKIFRGQVSFEVGCYKDEVTIRFHTAYIEVRYHPNAHPQRIPEFTEKKICNMIRSVLDSGIEQSIVSLHYSPEKTKYKFGLVCVKCCSAHEVIKEDCSMVCPNRKTVVVPNPGSYWFEMPTFVFKDEVTLKEGCALHKVPFSVAPIDKSSLKLSKDPPLSADSQVHVKLNSDLTVCFEDLKKQDEGMYKISGRNEHGCAEISFQLSVKSPTKYKFLQRYLKGVAAGSSPTLEFSVDPPVPDDTVHSLSKENGEAALPWFEVKHDRVIFQDVEEGDSGKYIISCRDTEGELVEETLVLKVMPSQPSNQHAPATYGAASLPGQGVQPLREQQEPAASRTVVEPCHYSCLMRQLSPYAWEWESIAEGLNFHWDEIKSIKAEPETRTGGNKFCLRAMLSQWMKWAKGDARGSKDRATLEALKGAVSGAGHLQVANELSLTD